ncbi:MAG: glycosyltransferase family 4 protein [Opitutales bacterium]
MKLLVLAQTPPPLHGQSLMVRTLVEGLPARGIAVHPVNLRLSRSAADIGRWRPGKILAVLDACRRAVAARFFQRCDTLYYVPAPGKRGALYRDWVVMLLCRPFFPKLVLHWHAAGLGAWLRDRATAPERWLTRFLLGRADLAIVLAGALRPDAEALAAKRIAVVANGIIDPGSGSRPARRGDAPTEVLFLGLGDESKGLFDLAAAVHEANRLSGVLQFRLTAAGDWPDEGTARRFDRLRKLHPDELTHAGFVQGEDKERLLRAASCLALPTRYANEGQPLVLLEAMAHDLPVIATNWRGIPETLPPDASHLVAPGNISTLVSALRELRRTPPPAGTARAHFLSHYTVEQHLGALAAALLVL